MISSPDAQIREQAKEARQAELPTNTIQLVGLVLDRSFVLVGQIARGLIDARVLITALVVFGVLAYGRPIAEIGALALAIAALLESSAFAIGGWITALVVGISSVVVVQVLWRRNQAQGRMLAEKKDRQLPGRASSRRPDETEEYLNQEFGDEPAD